MIVFCSIFGLIIGWFLGNIWWELVRDRVMRPKEGGYTPGDGYNYFMIYRKGYNGYLS